MLLKPCVKKLCWKNHGLKNCVEKTVLKYLIFFKENNGILPGSRISEGNPGPVPDPGKFEKVNPGPGQIPGPGSRFDPVPPPIPDYDSSSEYGPLIGWQFRLNEALVCDWLKRRWNIGRWLADINYFFGHGWPSVSSIRCVTGKCASYTTSAFVCFILNAFTLYLLIDLSISSHFRGQPISGKDLWKYFTVIGCRRKWHKIAIEVD